MYTTPGLELLLHMNVETLERAVREQHAGRGPALASTRSLSTRLAATLAAVRRAALAAVARRSPAPAVPCCA